MGNVSRMGQCILGILTISVLVGATAQAQPLGAESIVLQQHTLQVTDGYTLLQREFPAILPGDGRNDTVRILEDIELLPDKAGAVSLGQLRKSFDPGIPLRDLPSLAEKCRAKQLQNLQQCNTLAFAEQGACRTRSQAMLEFCDEWEGQEGCAYDEILGLVFCDDNVKPCEPKTCTPESPCNVGDVDGDGKDEKCVIGEVCGNEGAVCDEGWFWDCHCTTTYFPPRFPIGGARCECNCQ